MRNNHWYHVSSHGAVLFWIAANKGCTMNDLAEAMSLSRRQVRGIISDLRRAGMLYVQKEGRRHHYTVNLDTPFRLPALRDYTLRPVLSEFIGQGSIVLRSELHA
jgi:DNA-binding transcriptional ArsR family regulator